MRVVIQLFNKDPRGFALAKCQQGASNADNKRIAQGGGMCDDDFFARRETQVQQTIALFVWTFEPLDAPPAIERDFGKASRRRRFRL